MSKLMNRAGLLAAAFALALAVALALNAAGQTPATAQVPAATPTHTPAPTHTPTATHTPEVAQAQIVRGSDTDGNGLIEITTHTELNALRYDLDGDGRMNYDLNSDGIPDVSAAERVILDDLFDCPPDKCKGYELKEDISLASYDNWEPIGPWQSVFDGNGFSVTGLKGNNGLFGVIDGDSEAVVKNVDVVRAVITPRADQGGAVGALANVNHGTIIGSYVTGEIIRDALTFGSLGGLVGRNTGSGEIYASVADVNIKVTSLPAGNVIRVGGFVGKNDGVIHRSYAYGNVRNAIPFPATSANSGGKFKAHGFAVNHYVHGKIYSSFSYGDKIVTTGEHATVDTTKSKFPAEFASGWARNDGTTLITNSCDLADEWEFTCPTPTPMPTPTPTPTN